MACVALHPFPATGQVELACLFVADRFANQGIGAKLMQFAEGVARGRGATVLFCLSTQAFNYFQQKGGFTQASPDDLPAARRERYEKSGRRSLVLLKKLT